MKPRRLAHLLFWIMILFIFAYVFQRPLMELEGVPNIATVLFVLLGAGVVVGSFAAYELYTNESEGLAGFGILSIFLTIILILTHYSFLGILLFIAYSIGAIGRLFQIAQTQDRARRERRTALQTPPHNLPTEHAID